MKEGVMVVIRKDGKYLLGTETKESPIKGKWRLLGGKVEENETIEMAAKRELVEEAQISIKLIREIGTKPGDIMPVLIHFYLADYESGEMKPSPREVGELKFFSLEEIKKLELDRISRFVFEEYEKEL